MAVRIRLRRLGAKKRPFYRVVVADQRSPRDGRFIEAIGKYHPLEDPSLIEIDEERALEWLSKGAQPSEPVQNLLRVTGIWQKFKPNEPVSSKAKATKKPAASPAKAEKAETKAPAKSESKPEEPAEATEMSTPTESPTETPTETTTSTTETTPKS
jgi:small subunit ribosomal protein S16